MVGTAAASREWRVAGCAMTADGDEAGVDCGGAVCRAHPRACLIDRDYPTRTLFDEPMSEPAVRRPIKEWR